MHWAHAGTEPEMAWVRELRRRFREMRSRTSWRFWGLGCWVAVEREFAWFWMRESSSGPVASWNVTFLRIGFLTARMGFGVVAVLWEIIPETMGLE